MTSFAHLPKVSLLFGFWFLGTVVRILGNNINATKHNSWTADSAETHFPINNIDQ